MAKEDGDSTRLVGEYVLGTRLGSGSFAVVWRGKHRTSGLEVAIKEIDKKHLDPKVRDNLLKEISILTTIDHPNIIRLFERVETKDRIYLVLEYCGGGDLSEYIQRHGKVSESLARHFMRQLASGLQVLQEKYYIHRDLKPQNLLLSNHEVTPQLKIGDFGFARTLTPKDMAATLCGSPLYMAPEIIQNKKYDAKADLWSVGAILFQLVTGKPPFEGNNHIQLFHKILNATELQFPENALQELHADCMDLCRGLLRQNPVERITFKEFFNHQFLQEPGQTEDKKQLSVSPGREGAIERFIPSTSSMRHYSGISSSLQDRKEKSVVACPHDEPTKVTESPITVMGINSLESNVSYPKWSDDTQRSTNQLGVIDSTFIEKEYVLVNRDSGSLEMSSSLDTSLSCKKEASASNLDEQLHEPCVLGEAQKLSIVHPRTRLKFLQQSVELLAEIAQEKLNAGQFKESLAIELVVLAVLKKANEICDHWMSLTASISVGSSSNRQSLADTRSSAGALDAGGSMCLDSPSSAKSWMTQGFIAACDRAEKLSPHLMGEAAWMPDAMEIIYETALAQGKNGGVDDYFDNKGSAARFYSKAILLLSFIVEEATSLPMRPPFLLTSDNNKRIRSYITNLQSRQNRL